MMVRLVPYLAALQWIGGVILAASAVGRAREFRQRGAWPRIMAQTALGLFVLAGIIIALTIPSVARVVAGVLPAFAEPEPWRLSVFLTACQAGWILLLLSMGWTGMLGIVNRKRAAREELDRRRERVNVPGDRDAH
jgi:hypothetical protein